MSVYWKANFAAGDFSEITLGTGGYVEHQNATPAQSVATIVTSPVYASGYAAKCDLPLGVESGQARNCKLVRWDPMRNLSEAYYGVAMWFSPGFSTPNSDSAANVIQFQESGGLWGNFAYLYVARSGGGIPRLYIAKQMGGGWELLWADTVDLPTGRWIIFVFHLVYGASGHIQFWKDGVLKLDSAQDFSSSTGYAGSIFDSGIYSGDVPPQYVIVGEMRCASTYALAVPVPSGLTQHRLAISSDPSGLPFTLRKTA